MFNDRRGEAEDPSSLRSLGMTMRKEERAPLIILKPPKIPKAPKIPIIPVALFALFHYLYLRSA